MNYFVSKLDSFWGNLNGIITVQTLMISGSIIRCIGDIQGEKELSRVGRVISSSDTVHQCCYYARRARFPLSADAMLSNVENAEKMTNLLTSLMG